MKFMRKLHRWLGLLVGLQVVLWIASGFGMSLLDAREVAGEGQVAFESDMAMLSTDLQYLEPAAMLAMLPEGGAVQSMELKRELGFWVWRVQGPAGVKLYDARSGAIMKVDETRARWLAQNEYFGDGSIGAVTLMEEPTLEARDHPLPLWRVDFNDARHTRYYIGIDEGRILERRNDTWALFDIFWMLHTMDYAGRDDFNTPWVIAFACGASWLAISGMLLLLKSFRVIRD